MRCDEIRDLLPLLPVDLLDRDELTAVRAHLDAGCRHCAAELAAYGQTLSLLPLVLPPQEPRPVVKARLMARALDEPPARAKRKIAPAPAPASPSRMPWAYAAAASIVLALISSLLTASLIGARHAAETASLRQRIEEQAGQMQRQSEEMASLRTQMRDARESIQLVSSPGVAVIDLQGQGSVKQASARVFWDRGRSFWQVYVASLPPAAAGR